MTMPVILYAQMYMSSLSNMNDKFNSKYI